MEKVNIAEILKDCPIGMELDCTIFNDVTLYGIDASSENEYPIRIETKNGNFLDLTKYGTYSNVEEAKCVIFPKGKTTWEEFQRPFKDGDIVVTTLDNIAIIRKPIGKELSYVHGIMTGNGFCKVETAKVFVKRLAAEEEKQKLFQAIKNNGYYWNAETKTLEKLVIKQKFEIGDCVVHQRHHKYGKGEITQIFWIADEIVYNTRFEHFTIYCKTNDLCKYELVHVEPKFKAGDKVKRKDVDYTYIVTIAKLDDDYYDYVNEDGQCGVIHISAQDDWELVPNKFDITTLKPFDEVLVRSHNSDIWECDFFSLYNPECSNRFHCVGAWYNICIPYIGNEHLRGTTNDCDEYYKTWE